jgi:hypothetical protein
VYQGVEDLCSTCHGILNGRKRFCSNKCKYSSPYWRASVTSDPSERSGYPKKICPGCLQTFSPMNHRQRVCVECGKDRKTRLRILRYGLTKSKIEDLNNREHCDLCSRKPQHIDHDHKTGKIRGYLCPACNTALNRIEKIPDWPEKARAYLA